MAYSQREIDKMVNDVKAVKEIQKKYNILSFDQGNNNIHFSIEDFLKRFDKYEVKERNSTEYPFELYKETSNIYFFCVCTEEEYLEARGLK